MTGIELKEAIEELEFVKDRFYSFPKETGISNDIKNIQNAIKAINELEDYYAIGTVEECKEARERQIPKKPIHDGLYACPNCHTIMLQGAFEAKGKCCKECGQALDWSETV